MKISKPEIISQYGDTEYRADVTWNEGDKALYFSVPEEFSELVSSSSDAALVALLVPAMAAGEDIFLDGTVSERLFHNLSGAYQGLLKSMMPRLNKVTIHPAATCSKIHKASGVATGFSGGIDSYCTLADYFYSEVSDSFKVTHLLYNNVGSHGKKTNPEKLFEDRYEALSAVANRAGLPFIKVNSNVDVFYNDSLNFMQTHTIRNASVALLLQQGLGKYFYSSAYAFEDVFIRETDSMAHSDLVALPLLSTESLDAMSVGSEYTRAEKTIRVAGVSDSYRSLDVCIGDEVAGNCSKCMKCLRTLITLDIAGELDKYAGVFDLKVYQQHKNRYCSRMLSSRAPFDREIAELAQERHYRFPLKTHLGSLVRYYGSQGKSLLRSSKRLAGKLAR